MQATIFGSTSHVKILELNPALSDMDDTQLTLTDAQWEKLKKLECVLLNSFTVTKNMQTSNLTAAQFNIH